VQRYDIFIYGIERSDEMRLNRDIAFVLLALFLILEGLAGIGLGFGVLSVLASICALAAGILFLIYR